MNGKVIEIKYRNKELFDWENGELEEYLVLVEEEDRNHHSELAEDPLGIEVEHMIPGLVVV